MKFFLTSILFAGIIYLSSCSTKDDSSTNTFVVPSADSVTKNSTITIYFDNDTFAIRDLTVKNLPIEYVFASDTYSPNDSFWVTRIVVSDYMKKQISLNLTANNASTDAAGAYNVTANSSTLTDYTNGANKVYTILNGSTINVTSASYPITGTLNLSLYYNMKTTYATGTFQIYY